MELKKGDVVIRSIEGCTFVAKVTHVNARDREVNIEYVDDGNVELDVSFDEIHQIKGDQEKAIQSVVSCNKRIETLAKPLLGLVEDDYEARKKHQPTIFIHENKEEEEESKSAIILNGAENRLAAGGGLRALRYLKK